mmetsp:Transcript_2038/g.4817  ORF Transcript_2038/g.4817 Transcript_2038/m.4817 type:complete len:240 (+) Transcript_2038:2196-2915(+)
MVAGVASALEHVERPLSCGVEPHVATGVVDHQDVLPVGVAVREDLREREERCDCSGGQRPLEGVPVALHVVPLDELAEVLLQVPHREGIPAALGAHGAAALQHLPNPLPVHGLSGGVPVLWEDALLGAELHRQHLEPAELLVVGKLARADSPPRCIEEGNADLAVALCVLQPDGHDDGDVGHLVVAEELFLKGSQLARGGGPCLSPRSAGALEEFDRELCPLDQQVPQNILKQVAVEAD